MKRALAQRAKESGMTNGVGPSSPKPPLSIKTQDLSSEGQSSISDRPEKPLSSTPTSRLEALKQSSRSVSSPRPSSSSPRPKKRARESIVKLEEEAEDDSNASSFYLRHQNRALASELRMLQYELSRLERERDYRRAQCTKAVQILNSLQATWTQMESALQYGQPSEKANSGVPDNDAPPSTGSGSSVELIGALLNSLAALGGTHPCKKGRIREDGEENKNEVKPGDFMDEDGAQQLDDLLRITDNVSERAQILQKWIWAVLQEVSSSTEERQIHLNKPGTEHDKKVANLKAKNNTLKSQIKELSTSRDEMSKSDKRVRRGLYRLAAGRVKLKEVLKEIVVTDEDKEAAARWMEESPAAPTAQDTTTTTTHSTNGVGGGNKPADTAAMAALSKKVDELQEIAKARDGEIKKLLEQKEEQIKKINNLMLKTQDDDNKSLSEQQVRQSELFAQLTAKLLASERKAQSTEEKLEKLTKEWSQAIADTQAVQKAMEDMQMKHLKKWKDFSDNTTMDGDENGQNTSGLINAEEMIKLQHKLKQAIENVRQAETTRKALDEAVTMNQTLQSKLDEVKTKYSALQTSRSSGNGSNIHSSSSSSVPASETGPSTPKQKQSSSGSSTTPSGERSEGSEKHERDAAKLHKDYRKVRKDLAAAIASKEAAKAKLATNERERQSLSSANTRLLKQAAERDDVNAKSLSTILHLKQLTDQMSKEKENLENQIKSSQQVALAARLAANSRARVTEEFEKARKELDLQVKEWEDKYNHVSNEKEVLEGQLAKQRAVMATVLKDAEKSKNRCDELVAESTKLEDEKRQLKESLAVSKREAAKAESSSNRPRSLGDDSLGGMGSSSSGFTVDQLSTQVSVLKNRLFCPVCNVRDKNCILLRCRHMFCRHCVDENIRNRSRKCPACGSRFDTKDVAEIWL